VYKKINNEWCLWLLVSGDILDCFVPRKDDEYGGDDYERKRKTFLDCFAGSQRRR